MTRALFLEHNSRQRRGMEWDHSLYVYMSTHKHSGFNEIDAAVRQMLFCRDRHGRLPPPLYIGTTTTDIFVRYHDVWRGVAHYGHYDFMNAAFDALWQHKRWSLRRVAWVSAILRLTLQ